MPFRAPHICTCGRTVVSTDLCQCQRNRKAETDRRRPTSRERGYTTKWDHYRRHFLAIHPRCARCDAAATVVDHIVPHRGDQKLFWDKRNHQALCTRCHCGPKQSEERRSDG